MKENEYKTPSKEDLYMALATTFEYMCGRDDEDMCPSRDFLPWNIDCPFHIRCEKQEYVTASEWLKYLVSGDAGI